MCAAKTRSNSILKPRTSRSRNTSEAFKRVKPTYRSRQKEYANWLSNDFINSLLKQHFHHRSRLFWICDSPDRLYVLNTIRNAIVHRSASAIAKFEDYVINQHGYLASVNPSMADLLITKKRSNSKLIFIDLVDYYDELADILTK